MTGGASGPVGPEKHHHHVLIEPEEDRWAWRRRIRQNPHQLRIYRVAVGFAGLLLICLGLVTGPLPGPGGIPLVLLGLAIWSSEFEWAYRLRQRFKAEIKKFRGWPTGKKVVFWIIFFAVCATSGTPIFSSSVPRSGCPTSGRTCSSTCRASRRVSTVPAACWNDGMRADAYAYFDTDFLAFAHRGGALYPPNLHRENSRHAFGEAVALGYRYLETDVHLTADGVLVAFHDSDLDRVTDAVGRIAALPYEVVARARIGGQDPIPLLGSCSRPFPTPVSTSTPSPPPRWRPWLGRSPIMTPTTGSVSARSGSAGCIGSGGWSAHGRRRPPPRPGSRSTASVPG